MNVSVNIVNFLVTQSSKKKINKDLKFEQQENDINEVFKKRKTGRYWRRKSAEIAVGIR